MCIVCVCVCVCVCVWYFTLTLTRNLNHSLIEQIETEKLLTSLWGRPAAEKIGIFCPLAMLFIVSMADIPVWIISSG